MTQYVNYGSARGRCGHKHRTISGACKCLIADQKDCKRAGGYSDRTMYKLGNALYKDGRRVLVVLSGDEIQEYRDTMDKLGVNW